MNEKQLPRKKRLPINGVLLLDKPHGISSNLALQRARRIFNAEKAGHTGTLDPLASGLLPICFGEATKYSSDLLNADKTYIASLQLGVITSTADREGEIIEQRPVVLEQSQIEQQLEVFRGEIKQIPPMFSALKSKGKNLYELARQGIEIDRTPRVVKIHSLKIISLIEEILTLSVRCSKGTYIRTLAEDIGKALGCGAHLANLRRTAVGELSIEHAVDFSTLELSSEQTHTQLLAPIDSLLSNFPRIDLTADFCTRFQHGNPVSVISFFEEGHYRIYANNIFIGTGEVISGYLKPKRLVRFIES